MKAPILNFESLKKASKTYNELTFTGFLANVHRSLREGVITQEQVNELLAGNSR